MKKDYHINLANYFQTKPLYLDGEAFKKPNVRKLVEQPWQELEAAKSCEKSFEKKRDAKTKKKREKLWDNVTNTLCNLDFIQAKASAKLTYDLINEINSAFEVIPDNVVEIAKEKARQTRLEKYTQDLIACARGEISIEELEIPESIIPWSEEQINTEIERIKANPNRADRLRDFRVFLGQEATNLHDFSIDFDYFALQQAWNYSKEGPVGKAAEQDLLDVKNNLLLRTNPTRLLWNPFPLVIRTIKGHTQSISSVSMTPNGKVAITGSYDKSCIIWNLENGQLIKKLYGHTDEVLSVCITPDCKKAISGSYNSCIVWDLEKGKPILKLYENTAGFSAVSITHDGTRAITGYTDGSCKVWNLETGMPLKELLGLAINISSVTITADGKKAMASSIDKKWIFWDIKTGKSLTKFNSSYAHNTNMVVSITPNGNIAISGSQSKRYPNLIVLHDLKTGEWIKSFGGFGELTALSIYPDGERAISATSEFTYFACVVWELSNGTETIYHKVHSDFISAINVSSDGKRAISCSHDKTCKIWDLENGHQLKTIKTHAKPIYVVSMSTNGNWAISGSQYEFLLDRTTAIMWNLETGKIFWRLKKGSQIRAVSFNPNGKEVLIGLDDECILCDLITGQIVQSLIGHTSEVISINITPDGNRAILCSKDGSCIVYNLKNGHAIIKLYEQTDHVSSLSVTPDGTRAIMSSRDGSFIILNLVSGENSQLSASGFCIEAISINPDGKAAFIALGNECVFCDLITGQFLNVFRGHSEKVIALDITPDGKKAISCSMDGSCMIWDLKTGKLINTLNDYSEVFHRIYIYPDGIRAITKSNNNCILWDIDKGVKLSVFPVSSMITDISHSSKRVFGGTIQGEIFVLKIGKEVRKSGYCIITARIMWDFELHQYQKHSADCPICGHRFIAPQTVLETIGGISKNAELKPNQSPCLEFPDESWEHPGLLSECPKCNEKLKFNPFIAGGEGL